MLSLGDNQQVYDYCMSTINRDAAESSISVGEYYNAVVRAYANVKSSISCLLAQNGILLISPTDMDQIVVLAASLNSCEVAVQLFVGTPAGKKYIEETRTLKHIQSKEI